MLKRLILLKQTWLDEWCIFAGSIDGKVGD